MNSQVANFFHAVRTNEALQSQVDALRNAEKQSVLPKIVALAAQYGYHFTSAEYLKAITSRNKIEGTSDGDAQMEDLRSFTAGFNQAVIDRKGISKNTRGAACCEKDDGDAQMEDLRSFTAGFDQPVIDRKGISKNTRGAACCEKDDDDAQMEDLRSFTASFDQPVIDRKGISKNTRGAACCEKDDDDAHAHIQEYS